LPGDKPLPDHQVTGAVVMILTVKFLEEALHSSDGYEWAMVILPVGVLLIAFAVRVL
jgi:hypothetical protein